MKIHKDLAQLPIFNRAVITIGSFDGVHYGHQQIIQHINQLATEIDGESILITFDPHPRLVLQNQQDTELKLLSSIEEKATLLAQYGIDHLVITPFSKDFSHQHPDYYIEHFLIKYFQPAYIVIGYDHRFGANRQGDISYLRSFESKANFKVIEIDQKDIDAIAVSSSKIRKAIDNADIANANKLLGHPYSLQGTVVKGEQIGRTIGYPTANIKVSDPHKLIPPFGIYAALATIDGVTFQGMLYIGNRPTLEHLHNTTIEINLFDFEADIYDKTIDIQFIDFLRHDVKFDSLEGLTTQLAADKIAALAVLNKDI